MALNLTNDAYEAIQALKNHREWRIFVDALQAQMSVMMNNALEGPPEARQDATGYARGLRDLVAMIAFLEKPTRGGQVPKPMVKAREIASV